MSTVYAQRSSAVRAAKKVCGPDQEWVIQPVTNGFTYAVLDIKAAQPAPVEKFIPSYNHTVCPKCGSTEIYNGRTHKGLVVDEDTIAGCHACDWVQDDRAVTKKAPGQAVKAEVVKSNIVKPWQRAKVIISKAIGQGITSRKELLALCIKEGINKNTADGAHYEMCVRKS